MITRMNVVFGNVHQTADRLGETDATLRWIVVGHNEALLSPHGDQCPFVPSRVCWHDHETG